MQSSTSNDSLVASSDPGHPAIPKDDGLGCGTILLLIILSPLILVLFIFLFLLWLFLLPFRSCMHRHPASARTRPQPESVEGGSWFQPSRGGLWLYYRYWLLPVGTQPRGIVFISAGFGEHISRPGYLALAQRLNAAGYIACGVDHEGHGRSTGERAFYESIQSVVEDFLEFTRMPIQDVGREVPRFIFGHSMGGLIALSAAVKMCTPAVKARADNIPLRALILSAPAIAIDPKLATPPLKFAAQVLSSILPKLVLDGIPPGYISRNAEAVKRMQADQLIWQGGARARVGAEMLAEQKRVLSSLSTFDTPLLLQHGTKDAVIPPFASTLVYNGVASADKQFILYEGLYHEMFEDEECDRFFNDITKFLDDHTKEN